MKFTMDETMKHRVVGIAVIISIAVIFVPAIIKKNNQRLEEKRIVVELPVKPPQPEQTAQVDEPRLFAETKVAHVDLDTQVILDQTEQKLNQHPIAEPKPIQHAQQVGYPIGNGKDISDAVQAQLNKSVKSKAVTPKNAEKKSVVAKQIIISKKPLKLDSLSRFSVQVGVFSKATNAQSLQKELKKEGYDSRLVKTSFHGKPAVKLLIGSLTSSDAAQQLKIKLANDHNLQGFVTKRMG